MLQFDREALLKASTEQSWRVVYLSIQSLFFSLDIFHISPLSLNYFLEVLIWGINVQLYHLLKTSGGFRNPLKSEIEKASHGSFTKVSLFYNFAIPGLLAS